MNLRPAIHPGRTSEQSGFTILEFVIAVGLAVLVTGVFALFSESTGRVLASLTQQSAHNQTAGNGVEFMIGRVREANSVAVDGTGNTLTLSFDDDPLVDTDGDKKTWNDRDHYEQFTYLDSDTNVNTLANNYIIYSPNTNAPDTSVLVPSSTRKLSSLPIFALAGSNTVLINFGLLTTNATPFSQAIEIRTRAVLRNKTQ
ncbi:MAG TPA: hypothetical protein VGK40_09840 [Verrucomicrobiae bacterium]